MSDPIAYTWDDNDGLGGRPNPSQPTTQELNSALNQVFSAVNKTSATAELRILRSRKHTWVGDEENKLRFTIDDVLYTASQEQGK